MTERGDRAEARGGREACGNRKAGGGGGGRSGLPGMAAGCRRYEKISEKTTKYLKKPLALYAKICYNFARY